MKPPRLLAEWLKPCPKCEGTGNSLPPGKGWLGCGKCNCSGHVFTEDGEKAFQFLYRWIKAELEGDGFVSRDPD